MKQYRITKESIYASLLTYDQRNTIRSIREMLESCDPDPITVSVHATQEEAEAALRSYSTSIDITQAFVGRHVEVIVYWLYEETLDEDGDIINSENINDSGMPAEDEILTMIYGNEDDEDESEEDEDD